MPVQSLENSQKWHNPNTSTQRSVQGSRRTGIPASIDATNKLPSKVIANYSYNHRNNANVLSAGNKKQVFGGLDNDQSLLSGNEAADLQSMSMSGPRIGRGANKSRDGKNKTP